MSETETEMEIYPFRLVKCDRRPKETKAVALRRIKQGEVVLDRPWIARASFIVSNEDEKEETLKGCMEKPDILPTFTLAESQIIGGGTPISHTFSHLNTPAHLQLTCCLIQQHSYAATQWVEHNVFTRRTCKGVAPMDAERHKLAIQWLRLRGVSTQTLLFWVNRANFTALYEMMVGCAMSLDFVMSGTITGLVFCPILSTFNHSCVPNMVCKILPNSYVLVACDDIEPGQEMTFSYSTHAIGLADLGDVKEYYLNRFGFECDCDLHRGKVPLFHERATPPRSIGVIRYKNKLAAFILDKLGKHFCATFGARAAFSRVPCTRLKRSDECCKKDDWEEVRRIGHFVWLKFQQLLMEEPCFVFEVCSRYAGCVQHSEPDRIGSLLLALYERALERFCYNPVFLLKGYFAILLETLRKWTIKINNGKSTDTYMTGMDGEDLNTFLNHWIEIRKYSRLLFRSEHDLMFLEGHMFTGLQDYLRAMESTVKQVEKFTRKDEAEIAKCQTNMCISVSSNVTMMYLTTFGNKTTIQNVTYDEKVVDDSHVKKEMTVYVEQPKTIKVKKANQNKEVSTKSKAKKTKRRRTNKKSDSKIVAADAADTAGVCVDTPLDIDEEEDLFIPIQIPWEEDGEEDLFIPNQYDFFQGVQEIMV